MKEIDTFLKRKGRKIGSYDDFRSSMASNQNNIRKLFLELQQHELALSQFSVFERRINSVLDDPFGDFSY
ncbi:hypothetical protein [Portibacter marinus]|uniref:hypothetical protein n=1 Tax=Portibacter marinus TaxID=2898660 RepID=UPI001F33E6E2|nr:hypothetical protein [Portibacter marinus]